MFIDNINIDIPVILAPMAGITDYPVRKIARDMGCQLLYTEMVSSKGLIYGNSRTEDLIDFKEDRKGLIAVQIFGEKAESMLAAAKIVTEKFAPDIIDINMGCPAPKVTKNGAGVALMKDPEMVGKTINSIVNAIQLPVTVKIRKGWNEKQINALQIAKIAEKNGASAIAVHGRTGNQFYSGQADWDIIKNIKGEVSIPVIGNGDIYTPQDAENMINETGCDAVMIGRGARGNPWLLKRCIYYLTTGELISEPGYREKIEMAIDHLELAVEYYGEKYAIPRMRKHITWYLKGIPYSAAVKDKINKFYRLDRVKEELFNYKRQIADNITVNS